MKYLLLVVIFGLICSDAVFAKSRHFNGDGGNPEGMKIIMCQMKMASCYESFQKFAVHSSIEDTISSLRQIGIHSICEDISKAEQCTRNVLQEGDCDGIPSHERQAINKGLAFTNYICVDKIDEIDQHWECLLNDKVPVSIEQLKDHIRSGVEQCRLGVLVDVVEGSLIRNRQLSCTDDVLELVEEITKRATNALPHCS